MKSNKKELNIRIISAILMIIAIVLLFAGFRKVAIIMFVTVLTFDIIDAVIVYRSDKTDKKE